MTASHSPSSPNPPRTAVRVCKGAVTVGKRCRASGTMRSENRAYRSASAGSPVVRTNESAVAAASPVSMSTPRAASDGLGV